MIRIGVTSCNEVNSYLVCRGIEEHLETGTLCKACRPALQWDSQETMPAPRQEHSAASATGSSAKLGPDEQLAIWESLHNAEERASFQQPNESRAEPQHSLVVETVRSDHRCHVCGMAFHKQPNLRQHIRNHHEGGKEKVKARAKARREEAKEAEQAKIRQLVKQRYGPVDVGHSQYPTAAPGESLPAATPSGLGTQEFGGGRGLTLLTQPWSPPRPPTPFRCPVCYAPFQSEAELNYHCELYHITS